MFRKIMTTIALLTMALIGTAGPASAFDGWCVLEPVHCAVVQVGEDASRDQQRGATDEGPMNELRRTDGGAETATPSPTVEVGGLVHDVPVLVQISDEARSGIADGSTVDLPSDTIGLAPPAPSSSTTVDDSDDDVVADTSPEVRPVAAADTTTTQAAAAGQQEGTDMSAALDTGSDPAQAIAPGAAAAQLDPIVAGAIGALLVLLIASLLTGAFVVGRKSSR